MDHRRLSGDRDRSGGATILSPPSQVHFAFLHPRVRGFRFEKEKDGAVNFNDDEHIDVCQNIEVGLKQQYESCPELTDSFCIFALESAKVAVRKQYGFAKNERVTDNPLASGIIEWCVAVAVDRIGRVNELTLAEYLARIDKIKRSVKRHSTYGERGYYEFIRNYLA